jgi:hypothetical protein
MFKIDNKNKLYIRIFKSFYLVPVGLFYIFYLTGQDLYDHLKDFIKATISIFRNDYV